MRYCGEVRKNSGLLTDQIINASARCLSLLPAELMGQLTLGHPLVDFFPPFSQPISSYKTERFN